MTYKEQAEAIVDKYIDVDDGLDYDNGYGCGIDIYAAKQCALIDLSNSHMAVQRFIVSISNNLDGGYGNGLIKEQLEKYKAIKQAIEEL